MIYGASMYEEYVKRAFLGRKYSCFLINMMLKHSKVQICLRLK